MATENPSLPNGTNDKLAATLAELEAERQRRIEAGQWGRGTLPKLTATPRAGEAWQAAQQRALHEYLAEHPRRTAERPRIRLDGGRDCGPAADPRTAGSTIRGRPC